MTHDSGDAVTSNVKDGKNLNLIIFVSTGVYVVDFVQRHLFKHMMSQRVADDVDEMSEQLDTGAGQYS